MLSCIYILIKKLKNVNGLCVRQARDYQAQIAFGNHGFRTQVTFTFGRFFGQNVTQVSVLVLKTTFTCFLKRLAAPRTVLIFGILITSTSHC